MIDELPEFSTKIIIVLCSLIIYDDFTLKHTKLRNLLLLLQKYKADLAFIILIAMTGFEERGMAIFSTSFTAGTAAVFLWQSLFYSPVIASITFSFLSIACILALTKNEFKRGFHIIILPLLCGIVCGLTSLNIPYVGESFIKEITSPIGEAMKRAISKLPFTNKENNELIKALITGDRNHLSPETYKAFRDSGAAHILALSGFHLGIIYLVLSKLLLPLGNNPRTRKIKSVLLIMMTGIYSFSTGGAPSIIRAFIFICLREIAKILEREISLKQIFFTALCLQLIFSPRSITSIGFQLSYLAVAGIVYIYPHLKKCYPDEREDKSWMKSIWNTAVMSISCQTATTPVVWIVFKTFPKYFLLTNNIAIPLTSIIIPMAIIITLLNILGLCPMILIEALEFLLNNLVFSLNIISSM